MREEKDPYAQEASLRKLPFAELSRRRTASQVLESTELLIWHANNDHASIPATRLKFWKIMVGWDEAKLPGGATAGVGDDRAKYRTVAFGQEWKGPRPTVDTVEILQRRRDEARKERERRELEEAEMMEFVKEEEGDEMEGVERASEEDEDEDGGVSLDTGANDAADDDDDDDDNTSI